MSHELRTPFSSFYGLLGLLAETELVSRSSLLPFQLLLTRSPLRLPSEPRAARVRIHSSAVLRALARDHRLSSRLLETGSRRRQARGYPLQSRRRCRRLL